MLQPHVPAIFSVVVFILVRFRPSALTRQLWVYVLIQGNFQVDRCNFVENAQPISVDGRPKRIEMYVFSNENALVWMYSALWLTKSASGPCLTAPETWVTLVHRQQFNHGLFWGPGKCFFPIHVCVYCFQRNCNTVLSYCVCNVLK